MIHKQPTSRPIFGFLTGDMPSPVNREFFVLFLNRAMDARLTVGEEPCPVQDYKSIQIAAISRCYRRVSPFSGCVLCGLAGGSL